MTEHTLVVSEVFGPTVQGEGPHTGRVCGFIRLGACNLDCSWCDTPYTWDASRYDLKAELKRIPVDDVVAQVTDMDVPVVVLSGGEPLLQQGDHLDHLLVSLHKRGISVHVETNGTKQPTPGTAAMVDHFSVSPKLTNSGVAYAKRVRPEALAWFADRARTSGDVAFKFVVQTTDCLDEISDLAHTFGIPTGAIWCMGEGQEPAENTLHLIDVADAAIARRWNVTPRLHTLLWGTARGV